MKKPEMDAVEEKLLKKWSDVYSAFEAALYEQEDTFKDVEISEDWKKMISTVASESMKRQRADVSAVLTLMSSDEKGVEVLKKNLTEVEAPEDVETKITYMGAPKYLLTVTANDYKKAEKTLEKMAEEICKKIRKNGGEGSFEIREAAG
ncbi:hypothetical protein DRN67_03085 [Candidatus Micrarchaeota archaeon]|nr:MAG: hypothetical protein DRN67_03085 [Candidatus Micrarchaeota archaeon]